MRARVWLTVALGLAACGRPSPPPGVPARSNVARADYVGSKACARCHRGIYDEWLGSPMHRMTRLATPGAIRAPYDGHVFHFMGDTATMLSDGERRYMRLQMRRGGTQLYRITKVIGGREREDYVGRQVASTRPDAPWLGSDGLIMPVSFLLFDHRYRYKGYSVLLPERPRLIPGGRWRTTCIFCHDTEPLLDTLFDDLAGPDAPGYQGSVTDTLLPPDRLQRYRITNGAGLASTVRSEIGALGGDVQSTQNLPLRGLLHRAIRVTYHRFRQQNLVEIGIGCEDCHGGGRQHVHDGTPMTFRVVSPDFERVEPPGRADTRAANINRVCERCHTVMFSGYPYTWEGGRLDRNPGGSVINSGEAHDFLLGGCSDRMSCAACHDPHRRDPPDDLRRLGTLDGNGICLGCHRNLTGDRALAAHTHHDPHGAGSACIACHMPEKNLSLDLTLGRYHRIGSPDDPTRVERDRPLECSVCHQHRSVQSLVGTMESWWGRRYDRRALHALYGPDLGVNPLVATLERGKPHERAVAVTLAARGRLAETKSLAIDLLDNPLPLVRYYAERALDEVEPGRLHLDMSRPGPELVREARRQLGP